MKQKIKVTREQLEKNESICGHIYVGRPATTLNDGEEFCRIPDFIELEVEIPEDPEEFCERELIKEMIKPKKPRLVSLSKFIAKLEEQTFLTDFNYGAYIQRMQRKDLIAICEMLKVAKEFIEYQNEQDDYYGAKDVLEELNRLAEDAMGEL